VAGGKFGPIAFAAMAVCALLPAAAEAQTSFSGVPTAPRTAPSSTNLLAPDRGTPPRPPAAIPAEPTQDIGPVLAPPPSAGTTRSLGPVNSPGTAALTPPANPATPQPAAVPQGLGSLAPVARLARDAPPINSGLHWRVYSDRPDQGGAFRLIKEDRSANPQFLLPPGGYIVHVAFGLASAAKRVQVRTDIAREVFDIPAGGARFEGRVGDVRIPVGQITFDVFKGSQFEGIDRRALATEVPTGGLVLLPEGTYHVVSNYGDGNAVMRYDFRVQAGKLTDARINHRAAVITLKLVSERGGEALANTAWSVLTPGGDVIKESTGAFPSVVLAEGDYVAIARNEGKTYPPLNFTVESGFDREFEVLAR
jgi:hypothetical protein